jgi:transposase
MAVTVSAIRPVAHLPLILGILRQLEVATIIDGFLPLHPDHVLSGGRGVEALVLAILDGHHALYKVGTRLEERGMLSLLQGGLARESLNDYRLGQILDALFAANLNQVFGAVALQALAVYAIPTPWLHQDTTTVALYGAYTDPEEGKAKTRGEVAEEPAQPVAPRPAYGHSKDGRPDLKQVLLSLGVSGDGGLPLRLGLRDGNTSDSTETPVALEECLALGLAGVIGIVADSKAYSQRTLGLCIEKQIGLVTRVPRTCTVRQELEAWGRQQPALPVLLEKPGRTRQEGPRRWRGQSVLRCVDVEYADGRTEQEAIRFVVVHSDPLAQQEAKAYATAHAKEAERVADHITRVEAKHFACVADAEAAIADYEGRGSGRRGRRPQRWRSHVLRYRVEAFTHPQKRGRRGRPPKDEPRLEVISYRLRVAVEPLARAAADNGWTVLATTIAAEVCADAQIVQAYQEQHSTVEQGFRWIKNPAAIAPVWLEKPERIAALAMLTVVGLLVYTLLQRQVRLYLQSQQHQLPGNKGPTATPTAAVVLSLFTQVVMVQIQDGTTEMCQVYGLQDHHGMVCDALGVDRSWYGTPSTPQNSPMRTTPP